MRQLTLPIRRAAHHSFESYVPGQNAISLAQLREIRLLPAGSVAPPPIYLWGPAGCGKSHLLQALASQLQQQGAQVGFFDADTALPWPIDDRRNLTLFDACDSFDAARQQAAFALFVDAIARGTQVAAAGRLPPVDLPLRDDLRSRLGWGHVLALQPLAEDEVRLVLRNEARRRGLDLSDDVSAYILTHFARDLNSLMALLDRADEFALSQQRALTVPLIRQMQLDSSSAEAAP